MPIVGVFVDYVCRVVDNGKGWIVIFEVLLFVAAFVEVEDETWFWVFEDDCSEKSWFMMIVPPVDCAVNEEEDVVVKAVAFLDTQTPSLEIVSLLH